MHIYKPKPEEIPSGICECGCGRKTPIAKVTYRSKRQFRGYPIRFCSGHSRIRIGADRFESWKGGRYHHRGWVYVYCPEHPYHNADGYAFEHRLVMEQHLGRYLQPSEKVHHINGIQSDNRIENLIIMTQAQHCSIHHKGIPVSVKMREHLKRISPLGIKARWLKLHPPI